MDKQYKISQAKDVPGRDKPIWLTHGRAFEKPDGRIRLKLDSIPIPNADGEIWLNLFEINEEESDAGKDTLSGFDEPETGDDDINFGGSYSRRDTGRLGAAGSRGATGSHGPDNAQKLDQRIKARGER